MIMMMLLKHLMTIRNIRCAVNVGGKWIAIAHLLNNMFYKACSIALLQAFVIVSIFHETLGNMITYATS